MWNEGCQCHVRNVICGMKDVKCQRELLSKSDLTMESALQQAKAMEAVQR